MVSYLRVGMPDWTNMVTWSQVTLVCYYYDPIWASHSRIHPCTFESHYARVIQYLICFVSLKLYAVVKLYLIVSIDATQSWRLQVL